MTARRADESARHHRRPSYASRMAAGLWSIERLRAPTGRGTAARDILARDERDPGRRAAHARRGRARRPRRRARRGRPPMRSRACRPPAPSSSARSSAHGAGVYGVTTGVGVRKRVRVGADEMDAYNRRLLARPPHGGRPGRAARGRARGHGAARQRLREGHLRRAHRAARARRRRAQRRRDAARAPARLGGPERPRAARRPRARHLRRHAPGRQGGHLADQQQLLRHGPGGARAGRCRAPARGAARSPPRSTGRPSRPTPPPSTRRSPSARPYPGIASAQRAHARAARRLLPVAAGRRAQPPGSAHVPQRRRHPRRRRRRARLRLLPARDRAQRRAREPARRRSRTSSSSRSPNYEALPLAAALDFARIALVPAISSAQERSVKLLQAPLTGLGTGLQEAEAESNECALSELAWASQALMVEARSLAHPRLDRDGLDDARGGHRGPHHDGAAGRAPARASRSRSPRSCSRSGSSVAAQAVDVRGCAPLGARHRRRARAGARALRVRRRRRVDRPRPRRRRRARALGRARCRRLTPSRCGRGSAGSRRPGG